MADAATSIVELLVGIGCLVGAVATIRHPRLRWLGIVLAVAGIVAVVHAVAELAT